MGMCDVTVKCISMYYTYMLFFKASLCVDARKSLKVINSR